MYYMLEREIGDVVRWYYVYDKTKRTKTQVPMSTIEDAIKQLKSDSPFAFEDFIFGGMQGLEYTKLFEFEDPLTVREDFPEYFI